MSKVPNFNPLDFAKAQRGRNISEIAEAANLVEQHLGTKACIEFIRNACIADPTIPNTLLKQFRMIQIALQLGKFRDSEGMPSYSWPELEGHH